MMARKCLGTHLRRLLFFTVVVSGGLIFQLAYITGYTLGTSFTPRRHRNVLRGPRNPTAVLFTYVDERDVTHDVMTNTINNWGLLLPEIQPVMFTRNLSGAMATHAKKKNWHVIELSRRFPEQDDYPALTDLLNRINKTYTQSMFLVYSDNSVLYGDTLFKSLGMLHGVTGWFQTMFAVGKCSQVDMVKFGDTLSEDPGRISLVGRIYGSPVSDMAQHYLIFRSNFPWGQMPDFSVGGGLFNNWLVAYCLSNNYAVIDISETVDAVLQDSRENPAHSDASRRSHELNNIIIHDTPDTLYLGCTSCIPLESFFDESGVPALRSKRNKDLRLIRKNIFARLRTKNDTINIEKSHRMSVKKS